MGSVFLIIFLLKGDIMYIFLILGSLLFFSSSQTLED